MPRAGLSRDAVVELAVRLVDGTPDGFARLSLRAVRGFAREHPGLYAAAQVSPDSDDRAGAAVRLAAADVVEVIAAVLRGAGVPEAGLIDAIRVVRSAVHGFAVLESGDGFGLPDDLDVSFEALLDVLVAGVLTVTP